MSAGSSTPRLRAGVGVRAGAWVSVLVVAGLLAMHGLGAHGSMTGSMVAGDSTTSTDVSMSRMSAHPSSTPHLEDVVTAAEIGLVAPVAPSQGAHHVMASCVVVLSVALLLLLVVLPMGTRRRTPWLPEHLVRLLRRARAPDPPDLVRLCVCRC